MSILLLYFDGQMNYADLLPFRFNVTAVMLSSSMYFVKNNTMSLLATNALSRILTVESCSSIQFNFIPCLWIIATNNLIQKHTNKRFKTFVKIC